MLLKSAREVEVMARGGVILYDALQKAKAAVRPGISTMELDTIVEQFIRSHAGAEPAFKGLYGFPGSACISVNEEIVHGIPSRKRVLADAAIQAVVEPEGFSIVRELVGHAVGFSLHEELQVPNYGKPKRGKKLMPGLTIAIEPMVNVGTAKTRTLSDKWTVVTADGKRSAHFEHTIAVTDGEPRILTRPA